MSVAVQMALPLLVLRFSGSALGSHILLDTPVLLFAELPRDAVCLGLFRCRRHRAVPVLKIALPKAQKGANEGDAWTVQVRWSGWSVARVS